MRSILYIRVTIQTPMKKFYLILIQLVCAIAAYSHTPPNDFDYSIIFSGPFNNDLVSISINKQLVVNKFKVGNVDATNKGHLNLTQKASSITVYYNGVQIKKPKVDVSFIVELEISINDQIRKIEVDLRKGKVILINNQSTKNLDNNILIEQITEPVILF